MKYSEMRIKNSEMMNIADEYVKSLIGNSRIRFNGMLGDRGQPGTYIGYCEAGGTFSVIKEELLNKKLIKNGVLKSLKFIKEDIVKLISSIESKE